MSEEKMIRLGQIARKLNVGTATIVESMAKKGFEVENNPNSKISMEQVEMLKKEFKSSALDKEEASHLSIGKRHEPISMEPDSPKQEKAPEPEQKAAPVEAPKSEPKAEPAPAPEPTPKEETKPEVKAEEPKPIPVKPKEPDAPKVETESPKLEGIKVLGKIDLSKNPAPTQRHGGQGNRGQRHGGDNRKPQHQQKPQQDQKKPHAPQHKNIKPTPPVAPKPEVKPAAASSTPKEEVPRPKPSELISAKADSLKGLTVLGKIELPADKPKKKGGPVASSDERGRDKKRPRKRIDKGGSNAGGNRNQGQGGGNRNQGGQKGNNQNRGGQARVQKAEPTQKEIQDQIKQTLARLQGNKPGGGKSKSRRDKKAEREREVDHENEETKLLKVTEFISANDLAALLDVSVNQIISTCMSLGMFVSINQRLDAE
ncbi:translation initiation factor IF-2 N-terminal domain-containing protein, partial [Algoriphagus sp.]|uniref:translation initiation factor IF-2 N-terminal domain-containing protein n=1 Tax=Algoriphagus sp. TaxID=1872435 RepID=UPI0025E4F28C